MSNYLNFSVQTRKDLCEWIERKMGGGLITIEITQDQLDDAIDEAVEEFTKWAIQETQFLALNLDDYDSDDPDGGFTLPNNVTAVIALEEGSITGAQALGINTVYSLGGSAGGWSSRGVGGIGGNFGTTSSGGAEGWITYEAAMQYLDLVKRMTASAFDFEYNPRNKKMKLYPDPKQGRTNPKNLGHIVIGAQVIRPDTVQYGEAWVKKYALALAKITVGYVRAKYEGVPLLGGAQIDSSIKDEGIAERDELMAELQSTEGSFMNFFLL